MTAGDVTEAVMRRRVIPVVVLDELETAASVAQALEEGELRGAQRLLMTRAADPESVARMLTS